jgi:Icc-related predicted phosphoesterase
MKISIWSDLHLEGKKDFPTWKNPRSDILILGGDICLANHIYHNPTDDKPGIINKNDHIHQVRNYRNFFKHVDSEWNNIIILLGNHEHYSGRWENTENIMREEFSHYSNIHLLEQNKLVINDIVFLGATLWTDMNKNDPITMMSIRSEINDYKYIANFNDVNIWNKLSPYTTVAKYHETFTWLQQMIAEDKRKTVVATHHAPSFRSIHKKYRGQFIQNGAYASILDEFIMDNPHIILWAHGHIHNRFDYQIDNTRIICNPLGYTWEVTEFDPEFMIDI